MFRSLIRWFGHAAAQERTGREPRQARRFTPRLEGLEGRAAPASLLGAAFDGPALAGVRKGGEDMPALTRIGIGEEMSALAQLASASTVSNPAVDLVDAVFTLRSTH